MSRAVRECSGGPGSSGMGQVLGAVKRKAASGAGRQRMVCSHMTADAERLARKGDPLQG